MKLNRKWLNEEFVDLSHVSDKEYVSRRRLEIEIFACESSLSFSSSSCFCEEICALNSLISVRCSFKDELCMERRERSR